jgi:hypothetical protein
MDATVFVGDRQKTWLGPLPPWLIYRPGQGFAMYDSGRLVFTAGGRASAGANTDAASTSTGTTIRKSFRLFIGEDISSDTPSIL